MEVGADSGRAGSRAESSSSRAESSGRRIDGQSDQDDTVDSADGPGDSQASLLGLLATRQRQPRSFACPFCGKCVRSKENLKVCYTDFFVKNVLRFKLTAIYEFFRLLCKIFSFDNFVDSFQNELLSI